MSNTPGELIFPPLSDIFGDGGTGGGPAPEGAISNRGQLISDFAQRLHTGEGSPPPDDRGQLVSDFAHSLNPDGPPIHDFGQLVSDFVHALAPDAPPIRGADISAFVHNLHAGGGTFTAVDGGIGGLLGS